MDAGEGLCRRLDAVVLRELEGPLDHPPLEGVRVDPSRARHRICADLSGPCLVMPLVIVILQAGNGVLSV